MFAECSTGYYEMVCVATAIICYVRFQKATEAKEQTTETKEKMSHLVDVAIAISRPSSRDVTAADIEVQVTTTEMTTVYLFPFY